LNEETMKSCFSKGFTLIELMIALAIMSIVIAIAAPNYQEYMGQRRLNGATRQIAMHLMNARSESITKGKKVIVNLAGNNHQYAFVTDNDGTETITSGDTTGATWDIYPDYYDVTFTAASSGFNPVFRPDGTGKTGTINVSSSRSGLTAKQIVISRAGRIRIS